MAETKSLYDLWILESEDQSDAGRYQAFFEKYYELETEAYRKILDAMPETPFAFRTYQELQEALGFGHEAVIFMGFLAGINDCLETPNELETLTPESEVRLEIQFSDLLYKMHKVKARWLFDLPEWENVFSEEEQQAIAKKYHEDNTRRVDKIGRNDPCPCGSGKKYKKCCGKQA